LTNKATPAFWERYKRLPNEVRQLADKTYALFKQDPTHPSIQFKRVGRYWTARIGLHYRALAVAHDDVIVWFWIGSHAEYDQLLR
jgi:hypothetical protein